MLLVFYWKAIGYLRITVYMYICFVHTCKINLFLSSSAVYDLFLPVVKENDSDSKRSEADVDCAEQDVGCWSQVWSAR